MLFLRWSSNVRGSVTPEKHSQYKLTQIQSVNRLTKRWQTVIIVLHAELPFFDQEANAEQILHGLTKVLRIQSVLEQVWTTRVGNAILPKDGTAFL